MSPEQANREAVDHRVDLWALGVVMYEMLAGQRPFKAHYQHASLYAIMHEDPSPLSTCPEQVPLDLERIVNRLLEKSPDDRYQSAKAVVEDLNLLGSGGKLRNERILEEDDLEAFPANMISYWINPGEEADSSSNKKDEVTIEILDEAGTVIRNLKGSAKAGLNRTNWTLTRKGIEFSTNPFEKSESQNDAEPSGARVLPGTYTARITFNDASAETAIRVHMINESQ